MSIHIRPFEFNETDYEQISALSLANWPDDGDEIADWKHNDKVRPKEHFWHRFLIEDGGQIVGSGMYCETWWNTEPNQYQIGISVHPDHQRRGIGTTFYRFALAALQERGMVESVIMNSREDKLGALHILEREGYRLISRVPCSELQVDQFNPTPFAGLQDKLQNEGIRFTPLTTLIESDPEWQRKMWDLNWVFVQDEPRPDTPVRQPFEEYVQSTFDSPCFSPHCWFVAVDREQYVGFSQLWPNSNNPELLDTGWTGVDRPYRQRGIATALKLFAIEYAQQNEIQRIKTENEETNQMYNINMKLGFKPLPAWIEYRKDFAPEK